MGEVAREVVVQRFQGDLLAALHDLAHLGVALVQQGTQLGLADQADPQQAAHAVLHFHEVLELLERVHGQAVGLFNEQQVGVARREAARQQRIDLGAAVVGVAFAWHTGAQGAVHGGLNVGGLHGVAGGAGTGAGVGLYQHHRLVLFADALLQVFAQRGFAAAALAHDGNEAVALRALPQRGAHVAPALAGKHVGAALDVVHKGVAHQLEVLARGFGKGFVLE